MSAALLPEREGYLFPAATTHVRGKSSICFNGWNKPKVELDEVRH
jgi:hypothetical protein